MVININVVNKQDTEKRSLLMETFSLKQGITNFGHKLYKANNVKVIQTHQKSCFKPIRVYDLKPGESKRALESLMYLVPNKDIRFKSRTCANEIIQREWMQKEEISSTTA